MFNKGALSLLTNYGSDSSDDDVPGPRVSTKRTHKSDSEESQETLTRKKLPVPNFALNSHTLENSNVDDPNLHEGRVRTFPHERGNWATYVFIPYIYNNIDELIAIVINSVEMPGVQKIVDLHISLTKTVVLKHHWIDAFVDSIKNKIKHIKKFMVLFGNLNIYCNEERTRTFIGWQIRTGYDSLINIVEALDICLEEFGLSTFYKHPSFHMSIAYCVGDVESELKLKLSNLNVKVSAFMEDFGTENCYIYVDSIYCKTGNKYYTFALQ